MTYPVKWYNHSMQGAPLMTTGYVADGSAYRLLKTVLVDGFGDTTLDSVVWDAAENAAKATISAGHSFLEQSVIAIAGASIGDYNGEHRIIKVVDNDIWFELDSTPGGDPTGTITMRYPPLGWRLVDEEASANGGIFRTETDVGLVDMRFDNTAFSGSGGNTTTYACLMKAALVENVTSYSTYTGIHEHRWPASHSRGTRGWWLVGDGSMFWWFPRYAASNLYNAYPMGYIKPLRPGDKYHCMYGHYESTSTTNSSYEWDTANTSDYHRSRHLKWNNQEHAVFARGYHQVIGTVACGPYHMFNNPGGVVSYPNRADHGFYAMKGEPLMLENTSGVNVCRGYMPGVMAFLCHSSIYYYKVLTDIPGFDNEPVLCLPGAAYYNTNTNTMVGFRVGRSGWR